MTVITRQGPTRVADPREVVVGEDLIRTVRRSGMSVSAYLEQVDPSPEGARTDAFQRQLARFNIRTKANLERGIPASSINEFWHPKELDGTTQLADDRWMPEDATTKRFFASNQPQSWALFPEYINRILRATPLADDVLADLVAETTVIDSQSYQAIYLVDQVPNRRTFRIAEGAEIPRIFVKVGLQNVTLQKYGVVMEATYEYSRLVRIPIFTLYLSRIRQQIRLDLASEAAYVLVNGDGNNNAATNFNVSALDATAPAGPGAVTDPYLARIGDSGAVSTIAKKLTYQAWLSWRTSLYALPMTTIVGRQNELLQLLQLQMPSINPTLLLALADGQSQGGMGRLKLPKNDMWGDAQLVYLPFAPGGMLIGLNKNFALEMLVQQGSDLTETDKDILSQKNFTTLTQNSGFDKIIASASSTLTFA